MWKREELPIACSQIVNNMMCKIFKGNIRSLAPASNGTNGNGMNLTIMAASGLPDLYRKSIDVTTYFLYLY